MKPASVAGGSTLTRILLAVLLAAPVAAHANLVWPALYLEVRLFSWWAISAGLLIEYLFVRRLFGLSPKRAVIADATANALSALAGLLLIPAAGVVWEIFPGSMYMHAIGWGTFNPATWAGTFMLACVINAVVEGLVYRKVFKLEFRFRGRKFGWLILANALSVGVAFVSIRIAPVRL